MPLAHELVTPAMWDQEGMTPKRSWPTWGLYGDSVPSDGALSDAQRDIVYAYGYVPQPGDARRVWLVDIISDMRDARLTTLSCCRCRTMWQVTTAGYFTLTLTGRCPLCPSPTNS